MSDEIMKVAKKSNNEEVREFITVSRDEIAYGDSPRGWNKDTKIIWTDISDVVRDYDLIKDSDDEVIKSFDSSDDDFEALNAVIEDVKKEAPKGSYCQLIYINDYRGDLRVIKNGDPVLVSSLKLLKSDTDINDETSFHGIMFTTKNFKGSSTDKKAILEGDIQTFDTYCQGEVFCLFYSKEEKCEKCGSWNMVEDDCIGGVYGNGQYGDDLAEYLVEEATQHFGGQVSEYDLDNRED